MPMMRSHMFGGTNEQVPHQKESILGIFALFLDFRIWGSPHDCGGPLKGGEHPKLYIQGARVVFGVPGLQNPKLCNFFRKNQSRDNDHNSLYKTSIWASFVVLERKLEDLSKKV